MAPRLATALLLAGLLVPASGCLQCVPQLDVHHCRDETGRCDPTVQPVADWNPDLQDLFPDVARLVDAVERGKHGHADWTESQAQAFWSFYHVDPDEDDKRLLLRHDGGLFQVRILEC